jgi:hypothetical protein
VRVAVGVVRREDVAGGGVHDLRVARYKYVHFSSSPVGKHPKSIILTAQISPTCIPVE